jgi:predicted O-linked N-acetylglucosamine transferase (SPINDLY family)
MQAFNSLITINLDRQFDSTNLEQTVSYYEIVINRGDKNSHNYWNLGIGYLLIGREEDAQAVWLEPFTDANYTEIDILTNDFLTVLDRAANYQRQQKNLVQALLIRQSLWEFAPDQLENVLELIILAHRLNELTSKSLIDWEVSKLLSKATVGSVDEELIEQVLAALIYLPTELSIENIKLCLALIRDDGNNIISKTIVSATNLFYQNDIISFAIKVVEICNSIQPDRLDTLQVLVNFYIVTSAYDRAIEVAEEYYQLAKSIFEKLHGIYLVQKIHFTAGNWEDVLRTVNLHRQLLKKVLEISPQNSSHWQNQVMLTSSFFLPYIEDNPRINKTLQNQLASIHQQNIILKSIDPIHEPLMLQKKSDCLRIAYIGSTFKIHSVGWLSRWLIHHHNRESFQIFVYCIDINKENTFNHQWFRDKVNVTYYFEGDPAEIVAQIQADEIDILIDLDSLTFEKTCYVMACKPSPVQISWLGWDSTGIPTIDYFIADPYVLPDDAQDYYQERIWRLPQTYLAVDGFEIGVPTLHREHLDIPTDAIVYLSSQAGYKRHPDSIKCQMQIIKAVPNSYFLIKGIGDSETIKNLFGKLATEIGLSLDRLRFLDRDIDEPTHRANLAIADIVLDTFPYNGATTTLETLWMGIPLVTQVGQQFAARNSYTFMLNAGIEEGIAWSEEEYIQWGIKLGLDRQLRDKIAGKLRLGRTTAPVWNAKQFTLEMEQAYREMWAKYQEQQNLDVVGLHDLN